MSAAVPVPCTSFPRVHNPVRLPTLKEIVLGRTLATYVPISWSLLSQRRLSSIYYPELARGPKNGLKYAQLTPPIHERSSAFSGHLAL